MRLRWCVLATALVLVVTACGSSGGGSKNTAGNGLGGATSSTAPSPFFFSLSFEVFSGCDCFEPSR